MTDEPIPRCQALVYKRDCLRYTGGKRRFEMHYTKQQCTRRATHGDRCFQHPAAHGFTACRWARPFIEEARV